MEEGGQVCGEKSAALKISGHIETPKGSGSLKKRHDKVTSSRRTASEQNPRGESRVFYYGIDNTTSA